MQPALSIILCTHNPRRDYLDRTLTALKTQQLPVEEWELIVIDNASDRALASELDLSWHPHTQVIREDKLGLTHARLSGIQAAQAEVLIFVDDDNVLDRDYLEVANQISQTWPMLGAWGGQCLPEFEIEPPAWTEAFWEYLGIRPLAHDRWSNLRQWETTPIGAGLCVRRSVAIAYAESVRNDVSRSRFDRQGSQLLSCGDMDLAYTSCDWGLGTGLFTALKLHHLMPPNRLEEGYLLRMVEQSMYSRVMLNYLRDPIIPKRSWKETVKRILLPLISAKQRQQTPRDRRFQQASDRGYTLAMNQILQQL